jgi:hypothetical protein
MGKNPEMGSEIFFFSEWIDMGVKVLGFNADSKDKKNSLSDKMH